MAGVHLLIGIGEGLITATTVATVAKVRPDLVYALRALQPAAPVARAAGRRRCRHEASATGWFLAGGLLVALLLAGVVSNFASVQPGRAGLVARAGLHGRRRRQHHRRQLHGPAGEQDHEWRTARWPTTASGASTTRSCPPACPGCSGCCSRSRSAAASSGWSAARRPRHGRRRDQHGADGGLTWAPATRHAAATCDRDSSPVHRLAPEVKIAAMVLFTIAVVATPREAFWAFGGYAAAASRWWRRWPGCGLRLAAQRAADRAAVRAVRRRAAVPRARRAGRRGWAALSVDGLLRRVEHPRQGHARRARVAAAGRDHHDRDLIARPGPAALPAGLTQIATFMLRYLDVLVGEARRMRVARISRGDDPRFLWQVRGFAAGVGALFLRAFERGERVYLAMVSRGYTGPDARVWQRAGAAHRRAVGGRGDGAGGGRPPSPPRRSCCHDRVVRTAPRCDVTRRAVTRTRTGTSPCAAWT